MEKELKKQLETACSGTDDVLVKEELEELIRSSVKSGKPLKVKLGLDPTAPDIHLGHTVVLNKLRQFQDMGHQAILIIGDYTARIGDPSGRSALRPRLAPEKIDENAKTYMKQAFKILDAKKTEVVKNSKWLKPLKLEDILNLTSRFTVARMLERDDFKKRFAGNVPIAIMEFLYPIMQAYDSVAIESDIELGGTDQRFNLLVGRELQKEFGQKPQIAITMPILAGTDGVNKMSKSLGNYIGVTEKPEEIYGKVMSIPDSIIIAYFRLLTRLPVAEIDEIEKGIKEKGENPVHSKRRLAEMLVENMYERKKALLARQHFDLLFKEKKIPDDIEEYSLKDNPSFKGVKEIPVAALLAGCGLAASNTDARRLIEQGSVKINSEKISDVKTVFDKDFLDGIIIQKGKRFFRRIKL
ncbi:MAG: tyrosine--tRNA ligase [Actinobacteria bacterium]|nr:tyrosine--tRNA ligase [Actinomycetota bacterium]